MDPVALGNPQTRWILLPWADEMERQLDWMEEGGDRQGSTPSSSRSSSLRGGWDCGKRRWSRVNKPAFSCQLPAAVFQDAEEPLSLPRCGARRALIRDP
ncbi:unnamed protein product [Arctogadus glacialis]